MAAAVAAYYASGPPIGAAGDFYTASNASLFPHAIRRFVTSAMERMEGARLVEIGGGSGALAASLGIPVTLVEPHAGLREAQRARGLDAVTSLEALKEAPTLFLANEVLDALPLRRLLWTQDGTREGRVAWRDGSFVEVAGERVALDVPEGCAVEVPVGVRPLLEAMDRAAGARWIALFLDYGDERVEPRPGGTLRGYHEHRVTGPFERPGEQDVTADVDFGAVTRIAREAGFDLAGFVRQGDFLADLGLVDDLQAALARGDHDAYLAGKSLLLAGGMGERFKALALSKGVPVDPPLPGFRKDTYPGASRR